MPEGDTSKNNIISCKAKVRIPERHSSGLVLVYLDAETCVPLQCHSLVISGQELYLQDVSVPHGEVLALIRDGHAKYDIDKYSHGRVSSGLKYYLAGPAAQGIVSSVRANDPGLAESHLKKTLERVLSLRQIEVQVEYEILGRERFSEVTGGDRGEGISPEQRRAIALQYAKNDQNLAERIAQGLIDDVAPLRFTLRKADGASACGLAVLGMLDATMRDVTVAAGGDSSFGSVEINAALPDFYQGLSALVSGGGADAALSSELEGAIGRMDTTELAAAVKENDRIASGVVLSSAVEKALGGPVAAETSFAVMNSVEMEIQLNRWKGKTPPEQAGRGEDQSYRGLKVIKAHCILSPARGKNISRLRAGDNVRVILDQSSPLAKKIIMNLDLLENNKVKPIAVPVHSFKYSPGEGYSLYVKIAEGLLGRAVEEQDVRILMGDPKVEAAPQGPRTVMVIGVMAAIIAMAVVGFLLLAR